MVGKVLAREGGHDPGARRRGRLLYVGVTTVTVGRLTVDCTTGRAPAMREGRFPLGDPLILSDTADVPLSECHPRC